MDLPEIISKVNELKAEIDRVRPLTPVLEQQIMQKFRLDWNYHSNAIEGNSLTYGETRAFLMQGVTAKGKPLKDHLDIEGHDEAISYLEAFVKDQVSLSEKTIKELHKILLVRPYEVDAISPEGRPVKKTIQIGQYKKQPNHVKTRTGKIHFYASPTETPAKMGELVAWYRKNENELHPLILAASLHYEFVNIHPFDDGNGRMARLLMNLVFMNKGYVPVVLSIDRKNSDYFPALEKADAGDLDDFFSLIGEELIYSMELYLKGAKGENIEEENDLDKKIDLLQRRYKTISDSKKTKQFIKPNVGKQQGINLIEDNYLIPFTDQLNIQLSKFEVFFKKYYEPKPFLAVLFPPIRNQYTLFKYKGIMKNDYFISLSGELILHEFDFEIKYTVSHSTSTRLDTYSLIQENYNYKPSEKEINEHTKIIASIIYQKIEQSLQ